MIKTTRGRIFVDGGNLIIGANEYEGFMKNESAALINPRRYHNFKQKIFYNVIKTTRGRIFIDGGNLIIEANEYEGFMKNESAAQKYIRRFNLQI